MDKSLLAYYQENLEYMRDQAADFAREFPKIASRLEISNNECEDPYVERLLEGAAFLAAKVEGELDKSMPYMLESIVNNTLPFALELTPSFAVAELNHINWSGTLENPVLPASSQYDVIPEGFKTPCIFSTMLRTTLFPIVLQEARYMTLDLQKYDLTSEAGLYLKIQKTAECHIRQADDDLLVYLDMSGEMASRLQQHLQTEMDGAWTILDNRKQAAADVHFSIPMIDSSSDADFKNASVRGKKIFYLFAAFQAGFHFIKIRGLAPLLKDVKIGDSLELIITFHKRCPEFLQYLDNNSLRLNCVPVANIFRKRSDRLPIGIRHKHHLIPDRMDPLSYEVSQILSISLYNNENRKLLDLQRLYDTNYSGDEDAFNFFFQQRFPRQKGDTEKQRSSYAGQDVFVSFSGEQYREIQQDAVQFSADMLCTNRDLPLFLRNGTVLKAKERLSAQSATLITMPTSPMDPLLTGSGKDYAEKTACLMVHFSDMIWCDGEFPTDLLRKILHANLPHNQDTMSGVERSILLMQSKKEMFRYIQDGQVFFESGWKLRIVLDEFACAGVGYYLFGCILREFLKHYKPINTPGKIVLETKTQGRICEWMI